jgi:hypothetical protein
VLRRRPRGPFNVEIGGNHWTSRPTTEVHSLHEANEILRRYGHLASWAKLFNKRGELVALFMLFDGGHKRIPLEKQDLVDDYQVRYQFMSLHDVLNERDKRMS